MIVAHKASELTVSAAQLAENLRNFANNIENLDDAQKPTSHLADYLKATATKPEQLLNDGPSLAALAFWTARNAIASWDYPIYGKPLHSHLIQWWREPLRRIRSSPTGLALKQTSRVFLHIEDVVVVGPDWFLKAIDLPFPTYVESQPAWLALAKEILKDYFRAVIRGQMQDEGDYTICPHPCMKPLLAEYGRANPGRLVFGKYGEAGAKRPGELLDKLMDLVKGHLTKIPEWVFTPWKTTLLGLMPDPDQVDR